MFEKPSYSNSCIVLFCYGTNNFEKIPYVSHLNKGQDAYSDSERTTIGFELLSNEISIGSSSYLIGRPGWDDIKILISGWGYTWFQITDSRKDGVCFLQLILGSSLPLTILKALEFLEKRVLRKTKAEAEKDRIDLREFALNDKIRKVERAGKVVLMDGGDLYVSVFRDKSNTKNTPEYFLLASCVKDAACSEKDELIFIDSEGQLNEICLNFSKADQHLKDFSTLSKKIRVDKGFDELGGLASVLRFNKIASGFSHFLALTITGELYCWGSSRFGETGHGDLLECMFPRRNMALAGIPIASISCGVFHSAVLSEAGDVYTFGLNKYGQLGRIPEDTANQSYGLPELVTFQSLEEGPDISSVKCGPYHTLILDDGGQVWGAGSNESGEIHPSLPEYELSQPLSQADFSKQRRISKFEKMNAHHSVLTNEHVKFTIRAGHDCSFVIAQNFAKQKLRLKF